MDDLTVAPDSFCLDSAIEVPALRREFESSGIVQIQPFLKPVQAEWVRDHLRLRDDWRLILNAPGNAKALTFTREALAAMTEQQQLGLVRMAEAGSDRDFRYVYEVIRLFWKNERETLTVLGRFAEFMRSEPVLALIREITGSEDVVLSDARAMRYGPRHFQSVHNDRHEGYGRRAAYVMSLSPGWQDSWGGFLQFHEDDEVTVTRRLKPEMNTLNLFRVPKNHSVSAVTAEAKDYRYSVSGWFNANCA